MTGRHITIVSGQSRCGTSLVMQMLATAGVEIESDGHPAYENQRCTEDPVDAEWLASQRGKAIKLIDPHRFAIPTQFDYRIIWLDRDFNQQARSIAKFTAAMMGLHSDRRQVRVLRKSLAKDRPRCLAVLSSLSATPPLICRFEKLLARPKESAELITSYLDLPATAANAMAGVVIPRSPACYPGLLELSLIDRSAP